MAEDDDEEYNVETWIKEGISRCKDELTCMDGHWSIFNDATEPDEERGAALYATIKHLENLAVGIQTMYGVIVKLAPIDMMVELVRERMQTVEGAPIQVEPVTLGDGVVGFAFSREQIVVPDDIAELEDD